LDFVRWKVFIDDLVVDVVSLIVGDAVLALDDAKVQVDELVASFCGYLEELTESGAKAIVERVRVVST
jgi:hypothetical protein